MNTKWIRTTILAGFLVWTGTPLAQAFYNPNSGRWLNRDPIAEQGGENCYTFARNEPVEKIDACGLVAASVRSIEYRGHGSAEKNSTEWQYVNVDDMIHGQIPLDVTDSKPAASVTATLDDGFSARVAAWTALSRDSSLNALQMSTSLSGTITVCCPCPFKKIRANWSVSAALSGTAGNMGAQFDGEPGAFDNQDRPSSSKSGVKEKALNTSSYCTTFWFTIGGGWTDVSKTAITVSSASAQSTFECVE